MAVSRSSHLSLAQFGQSKLTVQIAGIQYVYIMVAQSITNGATTVNRTVGTNEQRLTSCEFVDMPGVYRPSNWRSV